MFNHFCVKHKLDARQCTGIGLYNPMAVTIACAKRKLGTKARSILRAFVSSLRLTRAFAKGIGSYDLVLLSETAHWIVRSDGCFNSSRQAQAWHESAQYIARFRVKLALDTSVCGRHRIVRSGAAVRNSPIGSYDPMAVSTACAKRKPGTKARSILRAFVACA